MKWNIKRTSTYCERVEAKPRQGDLFLFNAKNYHYAEKKENELQSLLL